MKFLYVAELVGKAGIYALKQALPIIKKERAVDFTLVCADGATGGGGLGRNHAAYIHKLGADAISTGECCFYKKDLVEHWAALPYVLRPHNLGSPGRGIPGLGWRIFKTGGEQRAAVLVLLGSNFNRIRENNPFEGLEELLQKLRAETPQIIVDFHSWASGEKWTFFTAADGLCSAVIGSHNRVQTADARILPGGSAVICDAGRTGSTESVGGADIAERINEYLTGIPNWTKEAWERPELQGVLVETDPQGRALGIEPLRFPVTPAKI
ncbi:MAG: YmdB family metallophosphoesterase [Spirochaetaceae bacterium]|nr:YmdB family metallophosphoesterase [Spirochaetaceae bacterium]